MRRHNPEMVQKLDETKRAATEGTLWGYVMVTAGSPPLPVSAGPATGGDEAATIDDQMQASGSNLAGVPLTIRRDIDVINR